MGSVFTIRFPPLFKGFMGFLSFPIELDMPNILPFGCLFPVDYYSSLITKTAGPFGLVIVMFALTAVVKRACAGASSDEWDLDSDGVIDKDEFMQAQPMGKFIGELCASIAFFLMFFFYPSSSVAAFLYLSCYTMDNPGESKLRYLIKDVGVDCESDAYLGMMPFDWSMIIGIGLGVPIIYACMLYANRHDLGRLRRFQIEAEDAEEQAKARRNSFADLTIDEFERAELMRLLEEAESERIEKKRFHLFRTLPTSLKKLTNGYTSKCFWFEIFECLRKLALVGFPCFFTAGSTEQRAIGMVICFITACILCWFQPYDDPNDTTLALLCQFEVFFCMVTAMVANDAKTSGAGDSDLIDYILTLTIGACVGYAMLVEAEIMEGMGEYLFGGGEQPQARGKREFIKPILQKSLQLVFDFGKWISKMFDKFNGVKDQAVVREATRRDRAEKHPELAKRHRITSWKQSQTFQQSDFGQAALEMEQAAEEGKANEGGGMEAGIGRLSRAITRRTLGDGAILEGVDLEGKGSCANVTIDTILNPHKAGLELTLGDLRKSSSEAAQRTAKSLAALMRATKSNMEASLSSQAALWPLLTPRGQHLTSPYKADVSTEVAREQLDDAASEVFEAQHELRGIAFLAGGGMQNPPINTTGIGHPKNAQEWKELVQLSVQASMTTAASLRTLRRVLSSLPTDQEDADIAGMRAGELATAFDGLISQLGMAAEATAATLRGLLSLSVAAGANPKFAPWYLAPKQELELDMASMTGSSPSSTPQSSARDGASDRKPTGGARRMSLDQRLKAARRRPSHAEKSGAITLAGMPSQAQLGKSLPSIFGLPDDEDSFARPPSQRNSARGRGVGISLPHAPTLPVPQATLEHRDFPEDMAEDSERLSTPVKLRGIQEGADEDRSPAGSLTAPSDADKDSPEPAKARRLKRNMTVGFSTPDLLKDDQSDDELTHRLGGIRKASISIAGVHDHDNDEARDPVLDYPDASLGAESSKGAASSPKFPKMMRGKSKKGGGEKSPPPMPLTSSDKKEKRPRDQKKV